MALSFATFNLKNLQVAGAPTYPNTPPATPAEYARKVEWTANQLRNLDADVIGFQELWDPQALADVFAHPALASQHYQLVTNAQTGTINNALAIRSGIQRLHTMWVSDFPADVSLNSKDQQIKLAVQSFGRAVLRVKITPAPEGSRQPKPIVVFVAHLKSKRPADVDFARNQSPNPPDKISMGSAISLIRRAAEAAALRVLVSNALDAGERVVVIGDLNDSQFAVTTDMLEAGARYRIDPTSRVASSSKWGLYSIATLQELRSLRDVYYTYVHEGFRESLDHILVSQHFYDHSNKREWAFKTARLFNDHLEDKENPKLKKTVSDHGQLKAEFRYKPA
ncbi:MAG: endonuclease/exonuclease/phosphatase family protein [Actinomycetota bacterium]